ncbi:hypothetical protein ACSBR2_020436 [Camellia fascicularis]
MPRSLVSMFVLLGIVVAGAALGCWMVWKFVIAEDGSVDVGVAQFVKWAMRVIAATFIFQLAIGFINLHTPLAMGALASCLSICFLIISFKWNGPEGRENVRQNCAEFLNRSGMVASWGTLWNSSRRSSGWSDSPVKGMIFPTTRRKEVFKKRVGEFHIQESTRHAVAELASSPKFTDWIIKHADRIQLLPDDSSDNTIGSGLDSIDENLVESGDRFSLFKW